MAKLFLKEFRCVQDTEDDDDSPYFLIFIGQIGEPKFSRLVRIRRESWDDEGIGSGDLKKPDALVSSNVNTACVVLVALMEEDDGPDFDGGTLTKLRSRMRHMYNITWTPLGGTDADFLRPEFRSALENFKGNDDILGVKVLNVNTSSGLLPLLRFKADGGEYKVRFRMGA